MARSLGLLVYALLLLAVPAFAEQSRPYRIGVLLPLSGPGATWGESVRHGAEFGLARMPKADQGRIQLFFEDDRLDAAAAVTAYRKLRTTENIDAVITMASQTARAVIPIAERDGVFTFAITTHVDSVSNTQLAVRLALVSQDQVELLARSLRERSLIRVALYATEHEAMIDHLNRFVEIAPRYGLSVVLRESVPRGEMDFKSSIVRLSRADVDVVLSAVLPNSLSSFSRQFRARFPTLPYWGFSQVEDLREVAAAEGAMEGMLFARQALDDGFVTAYRNQYGVSPQSFAAYSHDAVWLISDGLKAGHVTAPAMATHLKSIKEFHGACGTLSANKLNGYDVGSRLVRVKNADLEVVE